MRGSTVFLPVAEVSGPVINVLLTAFSDEIGYYILDERNRFGPAGLARFERSRGGHLRDDPRAGRVATIEIGKALTYEFAAIEGGAVHQNLGLMAQALGLGGLPFFAAHPLAWTQALGFQMQDLPFARSIGAGAAMTRLLLLDSYAAGPGSAGRGADQALMPALLPHHA